MNVLALLLALGAYPQHGETPDAPVLFAQKCAACHQPPDTRFAVERAWLDQVHRTA